MNIAIISPEYPPYSNWGGIATFNQQLAYLLASMGHTVHVITLDETDSGRELEVHRGVTVHYIPQHFGNKVINFLYFILPFGILRRVLNRYVSRTLFFLEWNLFALFAFYQLQRRYHFEVIHTPIYHSPTFFIHLFFRSIPLILHSQGPQELLNQYEFNLVPAGRKIGYRMDGWIKAKIEDLYVQWFARKVVCCSDHVLSYFTSKFNQSSLDILRIPNFIDTNQFSKRSCSLNKHNILFMGRMEYRKGPDIVLQSFLALAKRYKKLHLYFIGEEPMDGWFIKDKNTYGSFQQWMQPLAIDKSVLKRITFVGKFNTRKKLIQFLQQKAGIAILPSRYEPFGFVYIEAMMAGNLTIASDVGGGGEIIQSEKTGFTIQPKPDALTRVLEQILNMSEKSLQKIVHEAQQAVIQTFSSITIKHHYQKLYKEMFSD